MGRLLKYDLFLAAAAALALCACANVTNTPVTAATSQVPDADAYGSYLAGRLAASQHDMADAAALFRQSLASDPSNPDLLSRTLLYSASACNVDEAAKL